MNPLALSSAVVLALGVLGYLLFPQRQELVYVYEKSRKWEEVLRVVKEDDVETLNRREWMAYIRALKALKKKQLFPVSRKFFEIYWDEKLADELIVFCEINQQYDSYIYLLELAFEKTKLPRYLEKQSNYYSFTQQTAKQVETLKTLYELTGWERVLHSLYSFGEIDYTLNAMEESLESLSPESVLQLLRYYLWNQMSEKAFELVIEKIPLQSLPLDLLQTHIGFANYFFDDKETLRCLEHMYERFPKRVNLLNWARRAIYLGRIDQGSKLLIQAYNEEPSLPLLEEILEVLRDSLQKKKYYQFLVERFRYEVDEFYLGELSIAQSIDFGFNAALKSLMEVQNLTLDKGNSEDPEFKEFQRELRLKIHELRASLETDQEFLKELLAKEPQELDLPQLQYLVSQVELELRHLPYIKRLFELEPNDDVFLMGLALLSDQEEKLQLFEELYNSVNALNVAVFLQSLEGKDSIIDWALNPVRTPGIDEESFDQTLLAVAIELEGTNHFLEAIKILEQKEIRSRKNPLVLQTLARLYDSSGQTELALQRMQEYLELVGKDGEGLYFLAIYLEGIGKQQEAIETFEEALEFLTTEEFKFRRYRAEALLRVKGLQYAIQSYRQLILEDESDFFVRLRYLDLLLQSEKFKELRKRLSAEPADANFAQYLWRFYFALYMLEEDPTAAHNFLKRIANQDLNKEQTATLAQWKLELAVKYRNAQNLEQARLLLASLMEDYKALGMSNSFPVARAIRQIDGPKKALPFYQALINQGMDSDEIFLDYFEILEETSSVHAIVEALDLLNEEQLKKPVFQRFLIENQLNSGNVAAARQLLKEFDTNMSGYELYQQLPVRLEVASLFLREGLQAEAKEQYLWIAQNTMEKKVPPEYESSIAFAHNQAFGAKAALPYYQQLFDSENPQQNDVWVVIDYLQILKDLKMETELIQLLDEKKELRYKNLALMNFYLDSRQSWTLGELQQEIASVRGNFPRREILVWLNDLSINFSNQNKRELQKSIDRALLDEFQQDPQPANIYASVLLRINQSQRARHMLIKSLQSELPDQKLVSVLDLLLRLKETTAVRNYWKTRPDLAEREAFSRVSLTLDAMEGNLAPLKQKLKAEMEYEEARDLAYLCSELNVDFADLFYKKAAELGRQSNLDPAELSLLYLAANQRHEALKLFEGLEFESLNPQQKFAYLDLLINSEDMSQQDRAVQLLNKLPQEEFFQKQLLETASLFLLANRPSLISTRALEALELKPFPRDSMQILSAQGSSNPQWRSFLKQLIEHDQIKPFDDYLILAQALMSLGNSLEAEEILLAHLPEIRGELNPTIKLFDALDSNLRYPLIQDLIPWIPPPLQRNAQILSFQVQSLIHSGKVSSAMEILLDETLQSIDGFVDLQYSSAFTLRELTHQSESRTLFSTVETKLTQNTFEDRMKKAYCRWLLDGNEEAIPWFYKLVESDGLKQEFALDFLRILFTEKRWDEFEKLWNQLDDKTRATGRARRLEAEVLTERRQYLGARDILVQLETELTSRILLYNPLNREEPLADSHHKKNLQERLAHLSPRLRKEGLESIAYLYDQLGYLLDQAGDRRGALEYFLSANFLIPSPGRQNMVDYLENFLERGVRFQWESNNGVIVRRAMIEHVTSRRYTLQYQETGHWEDWQLIIEDLNRDEYKIALSPDLRSYHVELKGKLSAFIMRQPYTEFVAGSQEEVWQEQRGLRYRIDLPFDRNLTIEYGQSRYLQPGQSIARMDNLGLSYSVPVQSGGSWFFGYYQTFLKEFVNTGTNLFFSSAKGIYVGREWNGRWRKNFRWEISPGVYYDFAGITPSLRLGLRMRDYFYATYSLSFDRFSGSTVEQYMFEVRKEY